MWNCESHNLNKLWKEMRQNNIWAAKRKSLFNCRTKQEMYPRRPDSDAERRRMSSRKWDSLDWCEQWGNSIITNTLPFINHCQWTQREKRHPIVASYGVVPHKISLPRKTSFNMINVRMTKWRRLAWVAEGNNKSWLTPMTVRRIAAQGELEGGRNSPCWGAAGMSVVSRPFSK